MIGSWRETKPAGEIYDEGVEGLYPPGMYPVDAVVFDVNGSASLEYFHDGGLGASIDLQPGQAYYYGDHVFGATNSGLTYWNSRTGKGAFMSRNAYIPF